MIICLRSEADLLDFDLDLLGLHFLGMLLLLIEKLGVVYQPAHWRIGIRGNLHQIQPFALCHSQSLISGHDRRGNLIAYHAYFAYVYLLVYAILVLYLVVLHSVVLGCQKIPA